VHGGGPQIDQHLARLGIKTERVDGLRITDDHTMEVVEMVLGGRINKEIVALIGRSGGRAVGMSGIDDGLLLAQKLPEVRTKSGASIDTGRVGTIKSVRPQVVRALLESGVIPVIAPVAADAEGRSLNVNADTVAGAIAAEMKAEKLVLMTDTLGVCDAAGQLIPSLTEAEIARLRADEVIVGGMIPKVECALEALRGGVHKCHIIDGRTQHAILLELFTDEGVGTQIARARATGAR
jgi:acetylglutamate kinase